MSFIKKPRYKPLYKKFLKLKQNVQNRPKLLNFNKQKWKTLIQRLTRRPTKSWKTYKFYDYNRSYAPKFSYFFKNRFRFNLHARQSLNLFYGGLLKRYFKTLLKLTINDPQLKNNLYTSTTFLIERLESRLDSILYRSHFVPSIRSARQMILHNHIRVNGKKVKNNAFKLKKGDLVLVSPNLQKRIKSNLSRTTLWPLPPKYLQINYRTFQIVILDDITSINFASLLPFWVDVSSILNSYRV